MLNLSVETWLRFLAWLAAGLVVYAVYGYRHSRLDAARPRGGGGPGPASVTG
jgi:APA family basic amino acid/polyamine antiporter